MGNKITFVGSGNVAWNLANALDLAGHTIIQVISKSEENAKSLAQKYGAFYGTKPSELYNNADFVIVCINDDEYAALMPQLSAFTKGIICHTSGATHIDVMKESGSAYGVFYPLQSLTQSHLVNFLEVPLLIEGSSSSVEKKIYQLADSISNKVREVNSENRLRYHLAAVFANNFTNLMYVFAERLLESKELDFELLQPIIIETANRLKYDKASNLQTGPAVRHDNKVIERHLALLDDPQLKQVYDELTKIIMTFS